MKTIRQIMDGIDLPVDQMDKLWKKVPFDVRISEFDTLGGDKPPPDAEFEHLPLAAISADGEHRFYIHGRHVASIVWGVGYIRVDYPKGE